MIAWPSAGEHHATVPEATPQHDVVLRYNNVAVAIHWLTVALILAQIWLGFTFNYMERGPARADLFVWHKTVGATILTLALIRLAWRLSHKPPPFPEELPRWERFAAVWNHRVFYALLVGLPLTGLTAASGGADAATTPLALGLALPVIPGVSEALGESIGDVHRLLVYTTLALLALHVGAALKHQFVDRARVAGRMPPFRASAEEPVRPAD